MTASTLGDRAEELVPDSAVVLGAEGIRIDGMPHLVLCASLFYFRIPVPEWRDRLRLVRKSGYSCIDVYVPWNFHERQPGDFDFTGWRDVGAFLDLAAEEGLYAIVRPGPYICSEFDGGALPAWLGLDPDLRVRQAEPRYLAAVGSWFGAVLPIIAHRQHTGPATGAVILVQLENELDFFDCNDRAGYMTALRTMARESGLEVPLIACSGQGDIAGATGGVDGIVPACNFYPPDDSPVIEAEVRRYAARMRKRNLPLLVTETNRRHLTLRREILSGVKLAAPYLQVSGWNFEVGPSTGNWGDPGGFMTHSYDFGGYLAPDGQARPEYQQARRLAAVIAAHGPALALAAAAGTLPVRAETDYPTADSPGVLRLDGGGWIFGLPHLGQGEPARETQGTAVLTATDGTTVSALVAQGECPFFSADVPLGCSGARVVLAAAELAVFRLVADGSGETEGAVLFTATGSAEVALELGPAGMLFEQAGRVDAAGLRIRLAAGAATQQSQVVVDLGDGVRTRIVLCIEPDPFGVQPAGEEPAKGQGVDVADARIAPAMLYPPIPDAAVVACPPDGFLASPSPLEAAGVYRGRGRYRSRLPAGTRAVAVVGAADVVELRAGAQSWPVRTPFGATWLAELAGTAPEPVPLEIEVAIWGHSNFDDARLPALGLGSLRGVRSAVAVSDSCDASALWEVSGEGITGLSGAGAGWPGTAPAPLRTLGGWSSTRLGAPILYSREMPLPAGTTVHLLELRGLNAPVRVRAAGGEWETVTAHNTFVDLAPAFTGAPMSGAAPAPRSIRVDVVMDHNPDGPAPSALLHVGTRLGDWVLEPLPQENLNTMAGQELEVGAAVVQLPLEPEGKTWLDVALPRADVGRGWWLRPEGTGLRVSGWLGGQYLGQIWLGAGPRFTGGDPSVLWLPAALRHNSASVRLLLEPGGEKAVLERLRFDPARS